jgi:CDP-2,3-bis-(O-geranylgeranyl)-sn-glycerol synthase
MLPALVPNSAAVLFGGGTPIDFGKSWHGKRLLGDGKTWRGFFGGALTGLGVGAVQIIATTALDEQGEFGFGDLPWAVAIVVALSFGAMAGDCLGSFVKRRLGVDRGRKAPVLDQYNFVIGAVVSALVVSPGWFIGHYIEDNGIWGLVLFIIVVPVLHRSVNIIGYKLGKKDVPW